MRLAISACVLISSVPIAHAKPSTEHFGSVMQAQASADNAIAALEAAAKEVPKLIVKQQAEQVKLKELDAHKKALEDEMKRALEEARAGTVCSECHRPPTQIKSETGKDFKAHLAEVHGTEAVKATPAEIEKTRKAYQDKLDAVKQQRNDVARELRTINTSIDTQYTSAKSAFLFYMGIVPEIDKAQERDAKATRKRDDAVIESVEAMITQANHDLEKPKYNDIANRAEREDLVRWRDSLKFLMPDLDKERTRHTDAANHEQNLWDLLKRRRATHVRDLLDQLAIPSLSLPTRMFTLGGSPVELAVKGTPVTFTIDEYSVSVGLDLGNLLGASVSVGTDPLGAQPYFKTCLEAAGVASACMVRDPTSPNLDLGKPVVTIGDTEINLNSSESTFTPAKVEPSTQSEFKGTR